MRPVWCARVRRDIRAARGVVAARRLLAIGALAVAVGIGAASAQGAATVSCNRVVNPYPGTRYEGADLRRIRATGLSCTTARKVVRGAHRKALGITPPVSGVRHFTWNGWTVTGDLRGSSDTYVAARGSKRVRWVF
jgi:hypothetical protein